MLSDVAPLYPHLVAYVREMPWAIRPEKLAVIVDLLRFRSEGGRLTAEEIASRIGAAPTSSQQRSDGAVAVIPVYGVIVQRADMFTEMSGGTSTESVGRAFNAALNDPAVGSIVFDVDSPGGGVYGVAELAGQILTARGPKPIVAVANSMAASAAYWIASAADELVVTPGGEVGSIGVYTAHEDWSAALEAEGVDVTLISAGRYKTEGNPFEPLGEEARTAIQGRVDDYYGMFTNAVAKGRGVKASEVRSGFGQGRVVGAQEAKNLGMVDRVATLDETIARLSGSGRRSGQRAALMNQDALAMDVPIQWAVEDPDGPDVDWRRRRLRLRSH